MFKQLRNKFLILNLVIISVLMLVSFSSIYLITYSNVQREISGELRKASEGNPRFGENFKESHPDFNNDQHPDLDNSQPQPERSVAFTLVTDNNGAVSNVFSMISKDDDFYEAAKTAALSKSTTTGKFKLEGNSWTYIIKPFADGHRIVFLDITSRQGILRNLIYSFLVVGLVMLIVIFFISRFFANKSIQPIKDAFEKQKQFIEDASHELKTPLAVINTNVDVLLSNEEDSIKDQSKWLHYIKSEVERMTKLTKDLLYLTQIDHSDIQMVTSEFNMSETLENVILTMEAVVFENNIKLDYKIEPNLMLKGNSEQIKQVIFILLDNALKYTNLGGAVNINLNRHSDKIILSVANTGNGIPEENLEKIFDRFYRLDKSRSRSSGGYGLGLSIAKSIVEQHGGNISAKSILDKSTTFTIELPSAY